MEFLKWYIIISFSVLYGCYIMKNFMILIENIKRKHYILPFILFILIVLIPGIFELLTLFHNINNRNKNEIQPIFIKLDDNGNIDEQMNKIKEMIEDIENDNRDDK